MSSISQREYWAEVKATAERVREEALESDGDESDLLHEAIDSHTWIIYTWAYPYVLIHSDNEDALFDEGGAQEAESYSQIMQLMAFYAFYQDVGAALAELEDDEPEDD